jgi:3-hydroxybutyryl-CoA dehydrogenase
MTADYIGQVAVIGCGMIGPDISTSLLIHGIQVRMVGRNRGSISRGLANIEKDLTDLVEAEVISTEEKSAALGMVETATNICSAVRNADVVFEAVYEDLSVKQEVFAEIDRCCKDQALLCSSTSGLSPNDIGERIKHQDRMLVTHFWNPPHLMPLVEIVPHNRLEEQALRLAIALIEKLGKVPVILKKDIPGQIGNRLQHALYREALYLIEQGVADPADIDNVVLASFGPRFSKIGPMEYFDSCGLDLHEKVQRYLYPTLCNAAEPQKILIDSIRAGNLGQKSGRGLYDWSERDAEDFRRRRNQRFIDMLKGKAGGGR